MQNLEDNVVHVIAGRCVYIIQGHINRVIDIEGYDFGRMLKEVMIVEEQYQCFLFPCQSGEQS